LPLIFFPSHFFFALLRICITCRSLRDEEFSLPLIKIDQSKAKTNTMVNKYLKTPTPRTRRLCLLEWKLQRLLCFRSGALFWTMLATPNYSKRYKTNDFLHSSVATIVLENTNNVYYIELLVFFWKRKATIDQCWTYETC
jgi:hypothetical protein